MGYSSWGHKESDMIKWLNNNTVGTREIEETKQNFWSFESYIWVGEDSDKWTGRCIVYQIDITIIEKNTAEWEVEDRLLGRGFTVY